MRALALSTLLLVACAAPVPITDGDPPSSDGDAGPLEDGSMPRLDARVTPPAAAGSLAIASWNLESFPRDAGTIEAVRALIVEHDLDLIGVQEITEIEHFEALAAALPDHEMFVSFDDWAYTRVGFLYRPDRIRVGDVERLFRRDTYAFPRDPLMAQLEVLDLSGEPLFDFTFVVVHLKAQVNEESRLRRVAAIELLDAWVRERQVIEPDVMIIGDFNDELLDAGERNVFTPFLDAPERYRFLTADAERAGQASYITFDAMIDHVLITTELLDEYGEGTTEVLALDESMLSYPDLVSDHRPVVARFALP